MININIHRSVTTRPFKDLNDGHLMPTTLLADLAWNTLPENPKSAKSPRRSAMTDG
jgi:hypothetical protein